MTIAKTGSEVSYAGDGVSTAFSFPFRFFDDTDLEVYLVDSGSVSTLQTLTADYSVTNTGTEDGGTVTMVVPPTSGNTLLIRRMIPATQSVDYQNNDAFPAETHEQAIDRLTLLSQQLDNENNLAIRFPTGDTASPVLPVVADRANRILTFDSDGEFLLEDNTLGIAATYNTRAEFVTAVAGGLAVANGGVIAAAGKFYLADSTSTDISDLPGFKVLGNFFSASQFPSNREAYDFAEANGLMAETDEPNRFRGSKLTSGFNNTQNDAFVSYAVQVNSSNATRVRYNYVRGANSGTAADPGTGKWATNLARTVLYFNDTDNDGDDRSKDLKNLKEGMRVKLTDTADTTASAIFILNADAVDNGTYVALPDVRVEERGAGGFPLEASVCNLTSEGTQKDIGFAVHINIDDPLASGDTTAGFFRAVSNVNADQQNEGVRASAIGNYGSAVLRGPEADGTRITTGEVWGSYASAGFNQDNGVDLIGNSYDRANNATSGDPGSGNWGTRSDKTSLRISYTDGAGGDLTSALQAVGSGYKLGFRKKGNTSNLITWTIGAAGTDNGTYIQFDGLAAPDEAGNGTLIGDETEIIIYNGNTATDGKLVGIEIKAANWGGTVYDPLTASGENVGKYNIDFVAGADADNAFQRPVSAMMHNGNDTIGGWLYGGLFRNVRNDFMHFYQPLGSDVRALNLQKASSNLGSWAEEVIVLPDGTGIGWRDSAGTTISPVITRTGATTSVADNLDADRLYQNGVALELTRAEAITYLGTAPAHTDGTRFLIDNLTYEWSTGAADIGDLPNLVPTGRISTLHFGVARDAGIDDTSRINEFLAYCENRTGFFAPGTYRCNGSLTPKSNSTIKGVSGATILHQRGDKLFAPDEDLERLNLSGLLMDFRKSSGVTAYDTALAFKSHKECILENLEFIRYDDVTIMERRPQSATINTIDNTYRNWEVSACKALSVSLGQDGYQYSADGDGTTTVFDTGVAWPEESIGAVSVLQEDSNRVFSELTRTTDYTVSFSSGVLTVTFTTAPAANTRIHIYTSAARTDGNRRPISNNSWERIHASYIFSRGPQDIRWVDAETYSQCRWLLASNNSKVYVGNPYSDRTGQGGDYTAFEDCVVSYQIDFVTDITTIAGFDFGPGCFALSGRGVRPDRVWVSGGVNYLITENDARLVQLTGTISGTSGTAVVTGVGTKFLSELTLVGSTADLVEIDGNLFAISSIDSDTQITLATNLGATYSGEDIYRIHKSSGVDYVMDITSMGDGFLSNRSNQVGVVTYNSTTKRTGSATIAAGDTFIDVKHGLRRAPVIGEIMITPHSSIDRVFSLSSLGPSTFRININSSSLSDFDFGWRAELMELN